MYTSSQTNALLVADRQDLTIKQGESVEVILPVYVGPSYAIQRATLVPATVDPVAPVKTRITLSEALEAAVPAGTIIQVGKWQAEVAADVALFATQLEVLTDISAVVKGGEFVNLFGDYGQALVRAQIRRQDGLVIHQLRGGRLDNTQHRLIIDSKESLKIPATLSITGQAIQSSQLYWEADIIFPAVAPITDPPTPAESLEPYVFTVSGKLNVVAQHSYEGYRASNIYQATPSYPSALPHQPNTYNPYTQVNEPFSYLIYHYQPEMFDPTTNNPPADIPPVGFSGRQYLIPLRLDKQPPIPPAEPAPTPSPSPA